MRLNEKILLKQLREGRSEAYAAFVDAYGGRVHGLARRYARTEADAEDLTQEIFVALCRSVTSFRGESALSTWVYRVALNHCLRYQGRPWPEDISLDGAAAESMALPEAADPLRQATRQELADQVGAALDTLTPQHREVVILHELHGLTYAECAAILAVPIGTVKSRLSNAFGRLRTRLSDYVLGSEPIVDAAHAPGGTPRCATSAGRATK